MKFFYLLFLLLVSNFIITSCYYPKVEISSEEYNSIEYKKEQKIIFENKNKIQDTVLIYLNYPKGFEPNFDFWWNRKISKNDTISKKRSFEKKYVTYPKNKKSSLNLNLFIYYRKNEQDNGLILSVDYFKEKYNLNNYSLNDTLVFKEKDNLSQYINERSIKTIKYLKSRGMVYVEKRNGEIWKLKE